MVLVAIFPVFFEILLAALIKFSAFEGFFDNFGVFEKPLNHFTLCLR